MPLYVSSRLALLNPPVVASAPALGTPTFINSAFGSTPSASAVTTNVPTGTLDGHLIVAVYALSINSVTITPPGGWTLDADSSTTIAGRILIYHRVASSEPASYTWNTSAGSVQDLVLLTYEQTAAAPLDGTATTNTGVSTTATAPGITLTNNNTLLVMAALCQGTRTYSATNLTTEQADLGGAGHLSLGIFDGVQSVAGASGNKTATISSSATWYAMMAAFKPSGGV